MPTLKDASRDPTAYGFRMERGYVRLGAPPMPERPIGPASACEPPPSAAPGSFHLLKPPRDGAADVPMIWRPEPRRWDNPTPGTGRRMAFTSAYLAAHGWTYAGPAP